MARHILSYSNNTHKTWWKDKSIRTNVVHCMGCCLAVFYLGYDQSLLSALQSMPSWNAYFDNPSGTHLGLMSSALYFPGIVAAFVGAYISMKWGRRWSLWVGSALIIIGSIVNALSRNAGEFSGGRAIMGFGGAVAKVAAPPLLNEIAHPRVRPYIAASYYGWYFLGGTVSGYLCLAGLYIDGSWGWRMPCIAQIVAPALVILITLTGPESPRFLVSKGRDDEALDVLARYHANGLKTDELVLHEYAQIRASLAAEKEENKSTYLDMLKTRGNRRRVVMAALLAAGTNWTGTGLVGYYLTPILVSVGVESPEQTIHLNAGMNIFNLVVSQGSAVWIENFSRRSAFFFSTGGQAITMAMVAGLSAGFANGSKASGLAVIPMLFIYYGIYDVAWMSLPFHYCTEIMPFGIRSKGLAVFTATQTVSNAFNQFVNPIALEAITWKYYLVYVAINIAYCIYFYFYLIDTRGLSLEEVSVLFDYPRREAAQRAREEMHRRTGESVTSFEDEKGEKVQVAVQQAPVSV